MTATYNRQTTQQGVLQELQDRLIDATVAEISTDRRRGASELARISAQALGDWLHLQQQIDGGQANSQQASLQRLREAAIRLAEARPSMMAIANASAVVYMLAEASSAIGAASRGMVEQLVAGWSSAAQQVGEAAARLLIQRQINSVITVSRSSSIEHTVRYWTQLRRDAKLPPPRLIIAEARPLYEGLMLAQVALDAGAQVDVITDAQIGLFVDQASAAIVGADAIWPNGAVVNKVGTRLLALAAKGANIPFYVVAETLKFGPPYLPSFEKQKVELSAEERAAGNILSAAKSVEEVSVSWPGNARRLSVNIHNIYFEPTPANLITAYITEHGARTPSDAGQLADEAADRLNHFFEDMPQA